MHKYLFYILENEFYKKIVKELINCGLNYDICILNWMHK